MTSSIEHASVALSLDEDASRFREAFQQAGYRGRQVAELLGGTITVAPTPARMPALLQRTAGGTPRDTLVRLFLLGVSTELSTARRALEPMDLDRWARAGLVQVSDGSVVAKVRILPFEGLLLACDIPGSARPDFVTGIDTNSLSLLQVALGGPRGSTLDLGTGCGVQALLAALQSERVYATDRSPRALEFARFNAALNGIDNIEFLEGDRFDPVQGEFDLILCNPPVAISPDSTLLWRDSGPEGDGFSRKIVRQAPGFLREGGFCQLICHLAHRRGKKWQERLTRWFESSGCDGWVMRWDTRDLVDYPFSWPPESDEDTLAGRCSRWMDYYEREGIAAISTVLITMRRRQEGPNWLRVDESGPRLVGPCGEAIEQGFAANDFLVGAADDRVLADARLRLSPHVELVQRLKPGQGAWQPTAAELRLVQGISYTQAVEPIVANLIVRCDGTLKLRDVMSQLAAAQNTSPDKVPPAALEVVRRLIARGVLLPGDAQGSPPTTSGG